MQHEAVRSGKLAAVKTVHTVIYLVMVIAVFYTLYAAITRTYGMFLNISLGLLALECVVFFGNGMQCPFTNLAKKYGDPKGYVGDTFLPERITDQTFWFFGFLMLTGLAILALDLMS